MEQQGLIMQENDILVHYEQQADWDPEYFDWKISHYRANQAIMRSFEWIDWSNKSVLDIGCGQGFYAIPVSSYCQQITGIDLSPANTDIASRHASRLGLQNAKFINTDLLDYTPDQSFDIAYAITVLMHISDLSQALLKIHSLLKPGGLFLISDLNKYFHTRIIPSRRDTQFYFRTFSFKELRDNLQHAGFHILRESGRIYSIGGKRRPEWLVSLAAEDWAERWPIKYFGEHVAILAQKNEEL
jgi:2-polyprenyl-3-methyl-5-hydroxy-6-metoxy-1,4-benzoquinol methylase